VTAAAASTQPTAIHRLAESMSRTTAVGPPPPQLASAISTLHALYHISPTTNSNNLLQFMFKLTYLWKKRPGGIVLRMTWKV